MRVVDASVAIKWFLDEPLFAMARSLLEAGEPLGAPDLLVAEVVNAAWKRHVRGEITLDQASQIAVAVPQLLDRLIPSAALAPRTLAIAVALKHPAYDCFYLALAEVEDTRLITADRRLLERAKNSRWRTRVLDLARLRL